MAVPADARFDKLDGDLKVDLAEDRVRAGIAGALD